MSDQNPQNNRTERKYNYEDLLNDLKEHQLPARWCYIEVPDRLIFYYFSETNTTITIIVKPQMTQLVQVKDCTICETVSWDNFNDFLLNLMSRQYARVCEGIYPLNQKRSKDCCTIYFGEQHPINCTRQCQECHTSQLAIKRYLNAIQYQKKRLYCAKFGMDNLKLSLELIEDKFKLVQIYFQKLFS